MNRMYSWVSKWSYEHYFNNENSRTVYFKYSKSVWGRQKVETPEHGGECVKAELHLVDKDSGWQQLKSESILFLT